MLYTKEKLDKSLALLKKYEWLLDAYVLVRAYNICIRVKQNSDI